MRAQQYGIADAGGDPPRLLRRCGHAPGGRGQSEGAQDVAEDAAVLGRLDRGQWVAEERHACLLEGAREPERRLASERDDNAERSLERADVEHTLERDRLEVEAVAGVVVGGDRLRIGETLLEHIQPSEGV